ncbi:hypothetical protein CDLVIII_4613 [Clostridium sp. DL-VIII]|uniref:HTH domain-containing protein n=1 Tax=Clostridium sp. DL-VIII TaxID=641107 RepID=UPI00023B0821|nr:HTH domain-containing protein [Clostridium sp. DL-VIII]EHJ01120.1 hypothetical protein CDLVIII_4613 [Clostridium sp. DL-VIII]
MINKDSTKNEEVEIKCHVGKSNEEMLDFLIKEYKMNVKSLSKVLGVETWFLNNFNENKNKISVEDRGKFSSTLAVLYYISEITPDERNRGVIDSLVSEYNIELDTIARMADVKKDELINFMNGGISISDASKYKITTVSMFLHFIFKPSIDKWSLTIKAIKAGLDNETINKLVDVTYEELEGMRKLCNGKFARDTNEV